MKNACPRSVVLAFALGAASMCAASTLHVSPAGNDDASGAEAKPFRTIQKAADTARPGDTIQIAAGVYTESVNVTSSGQPGQPIVFQGQRGPKGEWLTIVDRSVPAKGWQPAPEIAPGVFKLRLPFAAYSMTLDDKQIARVHDNLMRKKEEGFSYLKIPADGTITMAYTKEPVPFWQGVEVIYAVQDGVTFIRFRNGEDPNTYNLKAAPEGCGFLIEDKGHVVLRDLRVRGAQDSVVIRGPQAVHNTVERCFLTNGHNRVVLSDGAAFNTVRANEMTLDYFGFNDPGAWGTPTPDDRTVTRLRLYRVFKLIVGPGASDDHGVLVRNVGQGNEVCYNHIYNGLIGVSCGASSRLRVHHNLIHNMSSIGILTSEDVSKGAVDLEVHDNVIYDCNINLRVHHYNNCLPGQRREYHYRNLFYQRPNLGTHIYFHLMDKQMRKGREHPEIFIYHNSFAGGERSVCVSAWAPDAGGLARTAIINNILSSKICFYASKPLVSGDTMMGAFDHNWLGGRFNHGAAVWLGPSNIRALDEAMWPDDKPPDYALPQDSPARARGLDLSRPFEANGKKFAALPGMEPGYFKCTAPDLGALQAGDSFAAGPDAAPAVQAKER